jgi:hypothetical protein
MDIEKYFTKNMNINQRLARTSFFIGFGLAIFLRVCVWLIQRRLRILQFKIVLILLVGGLSFYCHLDTLWVRVQWWLAVDDLHWKIQCIQWHSEWRSFLSYWDGFFTGAGWGILFGVGAMLVLARRQKI